MYKERTENLLFTWRFSFFSETANLVSNFSDEDQDPVQDRRAEEVLADLQLEIGERGPGPAIEKKGGTEDVPAPGTGEGQDPGHARGRARVKGTGGGTEGGPAPGAMTGGIEKIIYLLWAVGLIFYYNLFTMIFYFNLFVY